MKYTPETYAKALVEAVAKHSKKEEGRLSKNFLAALEKNGDRGALRKIVEVAESLILKKTGNAKWAVETARPLTQAKSVIKTLVKPGDATQEIVHPELIAGIRIVKDGEREFDGSLRRKMDKLFT